MTDVSDLEQQGLRRLGLKATQPHLKVLGLFQKSRGDTCRPRMYALSIYGICKECGEEAHAKYGK